MYLTRVPFIFIAIIHNASDHQFAIPFIWNNPIILTKTRSKWSHTKIVLAISDTPYVIGNVIRQRRQVKPIVLIRRPSGSRRPRPAINQTELPHRNCSGIQQHIQLTERWGIWQYPVCIPGLSRIITVRIRCWPVSACDSAGRFDITRAWTLCGCNYDASLMCHARKRTTR